ncbi:class I SAM-dependent methyltransferase [Saccharicrinis aurantiacus]|uniref:class I SAM-dependent methyltransferase n=1 Tax=Saccharicrinis aurantiacus TaxID=1849719 RepID=UPI0024921D33|nr:class I SAM-dependent methyltransferase [Saccharicrinis aurantiacus]
MDGQKFHKKMATGYFKSIYPVIANNIIKKSRKSQGLCVDVGGGTAVLGVEIARISQFNIINVDKDARSIQLAEEYIKSQEMEKRIIPLNCSAEDLQLASESADLVVSRGSVFFWEDKVKGMREIYRVLKPGGFAYVGGGMGNYKLSQQILTGLATDKTWIEETNWRYRQNLPIHLKLMMRETNIPNWSIESSQEGTWILINKK